MLDAVAQLVSHDVDRRVLGQLDGEEARVRTRERAVGVAVRGVIRRDFELLREVGGVVRKTRLTPHEDEEHLSLLVRERL